MTIWQESITSRRRDAWAESIVNYLERIGIGVYRYSRAQTGTVYIETGGKKIRVSDHSDAYGTADYTCDGLEGDLKGCKAWIHRELGHKIDREALAYERNVAKARKALEVAREKAFRHIYMPLLQAGREEEARAKCEDYLRPYLEALRVASEG